ncbi:MAG: radical SAM family heme chaperone HemW [Actinomycetota bacterium]|nr:radical SAM family heme chaperone HemW [Actinomycetota bacterium]
MTAPAPGFGLYIHTPFCRQKCSYCDFNSHPGLESLVVEYTRAVSAQIKQVGADRTWPEVKTIFFGGGNPALLGVDGISTLLEACRRVFKIVGSAEISMEMNPEDARSGFLGDVRDMGFNRLSLGWQSLDDSRLALLGRRHDKAGATASIGLARAAGFTNINVDMICGLPGQSEEAWQAELNEAAGYEPDHISAYMLTVAPGTRLARQVETGRVSLPDERSVVRMYEQTRKQLTQESYEQYEISNYTRVGHDCRHNLNYWAGGDYLGFGAGAHSHWRGRRWWAVNGPKAFIAGIKSGDEISGHEDLNSRQRASERIFLGLRLNKGVNIEEIKAEFGFNVAEVYADALAELKAQGLINTGRMIALTEKGRLFANEAMSLFV